MSRVYILGGGPAGLALSQELADQKIPFTLLEKGPTLGGLAQSLSWKSYGSHDLGPHKIFTTDPNLMKRVRALLPEDQWLTRQKLSTIYMKGHYLPYPPSPFSLINVYGPRKFAEMVGTYGIARARSLVSNAQPKTFRDDLVGRLGEELYEALFAPIARKLWGDPHKLDAKLSKGRVQTPKLTEVVARLLKIQKKSEFEALEFDYPRGGLQRLWDSIVKQAQSIGNFRCNVNVSALGVKEGRIASLSLQNADGSTQSIELGSDDFVFSTLPMGTLPAMMGNSLPQRYAASISDYIQLNDLLLVFLKVDRKSLIRESWVFIPDPDIVFHRLSEQESFDPDMVPDGSIVCCEIMDNELRDMKKKTDSELIELSLQGLKQMGYSGMKIEDSRVIRLPKSYPVFRPGFEKNLGEILTFLDSFKNFRSIGRQGAFNYIGTLDAMDIGYGAGRWFTHGARKKASADAWSSERTRTSHYPVLD